ncbi:hypothetical protein PVAND_010950 [Polypedilum vanderplanki]|uniref:VWFC domain-containing protein n=1 Tax=Polypedilum vanderplanki TaxID=319348 RepID=A0A9J6CHK8_POLVA|nr:hypothetical protein PVAND_010950 [Polypedilum vanderplanki]
MLKVSIICFFLFFGTAIAASIDCNIDECRKPMKIYEELGCKPIYGSKSCCPKRFECPDDIKVVKDADKCTYQGTSFAIGEVLPRKFTNESKCLEACVCSSRYHEDDATATAKFICEASDCGISSFKIPGCINIFGDVNECCSTSIVCDDEEKEKLATCWDGAVEYREGEKFISKSNPCYECLCHKEFDNTTITETSHCRKLNCEIELKYKSEIQRGCLPIFENDKCCPVDWKCTSQSKKVKRSPQEVLLTSEIKSTTVNKEEVKAQVLIIQPVTLSATTVNDEESQPISITESSKETTTINEESTESKILTTESIKVDETTDKSEENKTEQILTTTEAEISTKKEKEAFIITPTKSIISTTATTTESVTKAEVDLLKKLEEESTRIDESTTTIKSIVITSSNIQEESLSTTEIEVESTTIKEETTENVTNIKKDEETTTEVQKEVEKTTENVTESEKEDQSSTEIITKTLSTTPSSETPSPPKPTQFEVLKSTLQEIISNATMEGASFVNYTISRSLPVTELEVEVKSISKRSTEIYTKHSIKEKGCTFGQRQYKVGEQIKTDGECLLCFCNYAPLGHCIKKEKCIV